ncbi:MAG: hypothetical protein U1F65_02180 [Verrucomicrobiota bacterium]
MSSAIENLLPHRAPMRWIDALVDCTETTAKATVTFSSGHYAVAAGRVLETALVECIAQTIAAAQSQRARGPGGSGRPSVGMLAAVSNFKQHSPAPLDQVLEIEIREVKKFSPMLMVAGRIQCDSQLIAEGELTVYA